MKMVIFHSYVSHYQRVRGHWMVKSLWLLMNFPSDLWESLMVRLPEVMGHDFQALIFLTGRSEIL